MTGVPAVTADELFVPMPDGVDDPASPSSGNTYDRTVCRALAVRGHGSWGSRLLCVAAVTPRQGHDVLVEALAEIAALEWTCTCVGTLDHDRDHVDRVRGAIDRGVVRIQRRLLGLREAADARARCTELADAVADHVRGVPASSSMIWAVVAVASDSFTRLGARVQVRPSPWQLGPDEAALTAVWLDGWVRPPSNGSTCG